MKKLLLLLAIGYGVWNYYLKPSDSPVISNIGSDGGFFSQPVVTQPLAAPAPTAVSSRYSCDGRTHCSQMTSCEEATYFLRNCPGTQMDGEGDGVPCERQWCN
ncbi:MAG: excalibur calcium-binding domain-containing protein [Pseudomonas sp.]